MLPALTIFTGAFLLFLVQPLIGKYILPWFGGSPGVWTTCLLFFQSLLLGGYAYAHLTSTYLRPRSQAWLHLALLTLSLAWLPIAPGADWKPLTGDAPTARILLLLTACLGLPYLVLSATGPLIQRWFSLTNPGKSPYRLYALSNAGSLLALVSYPFLFEPLLSRATQGWFWSAGMAAFAALCGACAWQVRGLPDVARDSSPVDPPDSAALPSTLDPRPPTSDPHQPPPTIHHPPDSAPSSALNLPPSESHHPLPTIHRPLSSAPTPSRILFWLALPALASVLLVAITNKLSTDVAVTPFLWVLPLGLYLVTFILCFDHPRWYNRTLFSGLLAASCFAVWHLIDEGPSAPLRLQVTGYAISLFATCMVCHGELYRLKPSPDHLTAFYLCIAAGGALGGAAVALVAPAVFSDYHELPLGMWTLVYLVGVLSMIHRSRSLAAGAFAGTLAGLVLLPAMRAGKNAGLSDFLPEFGAELLRFHGDNWVLVAGILVFGFACLHGGWRPVAPDWRRRMSAYPLFMSILLGVVFIVQAVANTRTAVESVRNFYGTLKVRRYNSETAEHRYFTLSHGVTTHGIQFTEPPRSLQPISYYGPTSGVGRVIDLLAGSPGRHIGVVGLGAGTLAAYAVPGDRFRFYEINPEVTRLAHDRFTYLKDSVAVAAIVSGDARLTMESELRRGEPQEFDLLALDAFSSDAIPVHLLTAEAFDTYLRHLKPSGVIAVHISNRYLDLRPVVEAQARHHDLRYATISDDPDEDEEWWNYSTTWVLLSRNPRILEADEITAAADWPSDETAELILWTDDHASLLGVIK